MGKTALNVPVMEQEKFLDTPFFEMEERLSIRAIQALKIRDISTPRDLAKYSLEFFKKDFKSAGKKTSAEIEKLMENHNLPFKDFILA